MLFLIEKTARNKKDGSTIKVKIYYREEDKQIVFIDELGGTSYVDFEEFLSVIPKEVLHKIIAERN